MHGSICFRACFRAVVVFLVLGPLSGCCPAAPNIPPEALAGHVQNQGFEVTPLMVHVDSNRQRLALLQGTKVIETFQISTGKKGAGQRENTFQTPLGLHRVNEKIGHGVPKYGIFHKRRYIGQVWRKVPKAQHRKDYISTRILRLEGLQPGFNRGHDWLGRVVDSEKRAIYIHGTTLEWQLGTPFTKGCVHMSAADVIKLFQTVPVGTLVWIN